MKKKLLVMILVLVMALIAIYFLPGISVQNSNHTILSDDAYALGFNLYGEEIFKNKYEALSKFKEEYSEAISYLENCGFPKFSTNYETLVKYGIHSWQYEIRNDIENREKIELQLGEITVFIYTYWNSSWQHYFPFFKSLS